ncbi:hypothetical protein [Methyloglobulus sp.]|uniref:hypothetical protein n=1 Tax=Methyloglobulus sp. TaxID=2518622 RepID=UPI0032B775A3
MKRPRQPGLFDVEERAAQLADMGDTLLGLKARIDWEAFRPEPNRVHEKDREKYQLLPKEKAKPENPLGKTWQLVSATGLDKYDLNAYTLRFDTN